MSYTMTIDMRKEDFELAEAQAAVENVDLSKLFVAFLRARAERSGAMKSVADVKARQAVSPRVHALRGIVKLPEGFDEREFKTKRLEDRLGV